VTLKESLKKLSMTNLIAIQQKIILDFDLAELCQVETKVLNQAVKRNVDRFPKDFLFRVTKKEWDFLRSQFVTCHQ
jgi:hypothetical protein